MMTNPERFLDKETIQNIVDIAMKLTKNVGPITKTFVMGDIHGLDKKLMRMLNFIADDQHDPDDNSYRFIFLGDYVDRGPGSAQVIAIVRLLQELMPKDKVLALMGNHEDMLLQEIEERGFLMDNYATIQSFGTNIIPNDVVDWLNNLPLIAEDDKHIYVHAGLMPGVPIEKQRDSDLLWIREQFLYTRFNFGKHVLHGHTPRKNVEKKMYRTNLDTGAVFGGIMVAAEITNRTFPDLYYVLVGDLNQNVITFDERNK
jgi:serine/threonine protein phosphatase 1